MPAHVLPGLIIAVHATLGQRKNKSSKLPDDLEAYFVDCKNRIAPPAGNPGIPMSNFLNLGQGLTKPTQTWRRDFRTRDFTVQELDHLSDLREMVNQD